MATSDPDETIYRIAVAGQALIVGVLFSMGAYAAPGSPSSLAPESMGATSMLLAIVLAATTLLMAAAEVRL